MRFWLVRVALLVVLVLVAAGCDWTMFGYGPAHTRYNPTEHTIGVGNVASLTTAWTAATGATVFSSPAVAKGVVYVGSEDNMLYAFDAAGSTGCSGSPTTCNPLWTADTFNMILSSPAVVNGIVYVDSGDLLFAFDAAGSTGCSGSPTTCDPLWTAQTTVGDALISSPTVANGVVYVGSKDHKLYAFDAAGSTNCSGGFPGKTCSPLWTAATGSLIVSSPAVANGVVYIASGFTLYAFDAAGSTGCSGTPKTCRPLWTANTTIGGFSIESSPAVANGVVYIASNDGKLYAFDAAGSTGCSGTPETCAPLWTANFVDSTLSSPAIANGVVYIGAGNSLFAYDAARSTNCSGTPKTCEPLWTANTTVGFSVNSSPAVANGVVYIGSEDDKLYAFDAAGSTGCSGTPTTCSPLWTATTGDSIFSSPTVANGVVYIGSDDHHLYAFKP